jgi:hypothetical protein
MLPSANGIECFVCCDSISFFSIFTALTAGAGVPANGGGIVVTTSNRAQPTMWERALDRLNDHGNVSTHGTDAHGSELDRLRTENNHLRDLVVCLTTLLVKKAADR